MIALATAGLAGLVTCALAIFGLRRILFALAALQSSAASDRSKATPPVLVLLAAHNEAPVVAAALHSLERLQYPSQQIEITLINDRSIDETGAILEHWAKHHPRTRVVTISATIDKAQGKAHALAAGLAASPRSELVAVVDADFEVLPDCLSLLVSRFADPSVAAVSGYLRPRNSDVSVVARYAALEAWQHQLVTSAAKDRLGLDPPTMGLWMVRREVLDAIGGFPRAITGEDVRTAAAIARLGMRSRFCATAVAENAVAETFAEFWWQHLRWTQDVYRAESGEQAASKERLLLPRLQPEAFAFPSFARRTERLLSMTGYADRLALVTAGLLVSLGAMPAIVVVAYVATLLLEVGIALQRSGTGIRKAPRILTAAAIMFGVDIAATAVATVAAATRKESSWQRPPRRGASKPRPG